jgi:nitrite reductase/ring-hydroxylating ferredoxin subunit
MAGEFDWSSHPSAPKSGDVLCPIAMLPENAPKFFAFNASSPTPFVYFVVKRGQRLDVFLNRCPHKDLQIGTRDKKPSYSAGEVTCVQHKAVFSVDTGKCVRGVCVGRSMSRIEVETKNGEVIVA